MRPFGKLNSFLLLAAVFLGIAGQLAPVTGFTYDRNTDRPGGDYTSSEVPGNDPRVCAARCEIESQCLAWSYTPPGVQGPAARCSLKNTVPAPVANSNAVSDVRPFEYNTNRLGSNYTDFDLPVANPAMCAARCSGDAQCQAWSYVIPGVQGALAHCWLKNAVPSATAANFTVSGVRSYEYDTDRAGSDYTNFELQQADPAACAARCSGDAQCRAWTYVIPGVQGPGARCWLKSAVPPSVAADFAVSGVRGFEYDIDRRGGDYNDFALDAPDPQLCAARCAGDSQCAAWTYLKPGTTVGGGARCSLKNSVPPQTPSVAAVSGLRAGAPPLAGGTGSYAGCFPDDATRDLNGYNFSANNMTIESCSATCKQNGFSYAGTQFGSYCFCGNTVGRIGAANESLCTNPCSGNPAQICGGSYANSVRRLN